MATVTYEIHERLTGEVWDGKNATEISAVVGEDTEVTVAGDMLVLVTALPGGGRKLRVVESGSLVSAGPLVTAADRLAAYVRVTAR